MFGSLVAMGLLTLIKLIGINYFLPLSAVTERLKSRPCATVR